MRQEDWGKDAIASYQKEKNQFEKEGNMYDFILKICLHKVTYIITCTEFRTLSSSFAMLVFKG